MTSSEDLQAERDRKNEEDRERYDRAIEAREHAEEYQNDLDEANQAADDAEREARGEEG